MNFSMKFRENTHIFTLKKILQERHGRIDDLSLCFHAYTEMNEIKDEMLTLKQCGLKGAPLVKPTVEEQEFLDAAAGVPSSSGNATGEGAGGAREGEEGKDAVASGNNDDGENDGDVNGGTAAVNTPSKPVQDTEYEIPSYQLFYDFKPTNYSDPVVLYFH